MSTPGLPALTPVGTDPPGTTRAATPHTRGGGAAISHAQWGHHPHALHGAPTSHAERGHRPRALEGAIPMHTWRGRRPHMHDGGIAPVRLHRLHHPPPPDTPRTAEPKRGSLGLWVWEQPHGRRWGRLFACSFAYGLDEAGGEVAHAVVAGPVVVNAALPAPVHVLLQHLRAGAGSGAGATSGVPPVPVSPPPPPQPHSR